MRRYQLFKQLEPETPHPFVIHETFSTSDGLRTRICDGRYSTETDAREALKAKERT